MQRIFHTPEGVRDIYNGECSQKHHLQTEMQPQKTAPEGAPPGVFEIWI